MSDIFYECGSLIRAARMIPNVVILFLCKLNLTTTFESITAMNEAEFDGREKIMYIFLLIFFAKRRQTVEKVIFQK